MCFASCTVPYLVLVVMVHTLLIWIETMRHHYMYSYIMFGLAHTVTFYQDAETVHGKEIAYLHMYVAIQKHAYYSWHLCSLHLHFIATASSVYPVIQSCHDSSYIATCSIQLELMQSPSNYSSWSRYTCQRWVFLLFTQKLSSKVIVWLDQTSAL